MPHSRRCHFYFGIKKNYAFSVGSAHSLRQAIRQAHPAKQAVCHAGQHAAPPVGARHCGDGRLERAGVQQDKGDQRRRLGAIAPGVVGAALNENVSGFQQHFASSIMA